MILRAWFTLPIWVGRGLSEVVRVPCIDSLHSDNSSKTVRHGFLFAVLRSGRFNPPLPTHLFSETDRAQNELAKSENE